MMMKKAFLIVTITAVSLFVPMHKSGIQLVSADIMVQFVFNNGEGPSDTVYCSKNDYEKIDKIFQSKNINTAHRHLRSTKYHHPPRTDTIETVSRELRTYSRYCKNYCAKYAPGTCRTTNCLGYRRRHRRRSLNKRAPSDPVDHTVTCREGLIYVHTKLNELISKKSISNSCQRFINNHTRIATCYDDVVYGEVEGYRIWNLSANATNSTNNNSTMIATSNNGNAYGNTPSSLLFESYIMDTSGRSGYAFCRSTTFNVEVMTNECVDRVQIIIEGPHQYHLDRTDSDMPFTVFTTTTNTTTSGKTKVITNMGKMIIQMGQTVPHVGIYNITILPDSILTKKKQFDFSILDC